MSKDLYTILELSPDCSTNDIKKNYYKLAKLYHPDKNNSPDAKIKFQEIQYAYNILSDDNNRKEYNKINKKDDFHSLLEKIYNGGKVDWEKEFNDLNIKINFKKLKNNITDIMEHINIPELFKLYNQNIIPKKDFSNNICSDSDIPVWDENHCEYYQINNLPIIYQKYNKNNIYLELNVTFDDIYNNNIRQLKLVRKVDGENINIKYHFKLCSPYIVYYNGGDIDDTCGHLIIKLILPTNFYWGDNNIYYNYDINLFQYIYGIKMNINFINNQQIKIDNFIPYRDGNYYFINDNISIYFNLVYNHTEDKKILLYQNFTH